ncbi:mitochondrial basic amino acids transporter [Folsomia candida]|uniref:mitochondrial basic amino acids transporter n=1 Tax=Folsomia candida TaxID=158441 RepID=UPI000B8F0AE1|nr:mitochondrial basic amino acids transporter [Folsomia candida]
MSLDFLAGCVGGAAGVIVGHPLDTVKVRLQIQSSDNIKYKGTFDCLRTIVKHEGSRGLYKGISSPLFGVAGVNALIFGVYGSLRPYVHGEPGHGALWAHFAAGSVSGAVQSFIASPMELVKTRMQVNESQATPSTSSPNKAPSSMEVLRSIYQKEGGLIRGVFKGWGVTVAREIPGFGTYFATYEALTTRSQEVGTFGMMMAGGLAGVMSWIVTFPIDVVKTRLQSDVSGKYSGAIDCLKKTYQAEGYSAFSRGLVSTVIRAFPTNAATFTVVTWIMRWAESNRIDSVEDGREYIKDILSESAKTFEGSLRLPLPHYYLSSTTNGDSANFSLASSCLNLSTKYGLNSQHYFNFYESLSSGKQGSEEQNGLIREKFSEAFRNERVTEQAKAEAEREILIRNLTPSNPDTSKPTGPLPLKVVQAGSVGEEFQQQQKLSQEEDVEVVGGAGGHDPSSFFVTDDGSRTILILNLVCRLQSFILHFWDNFLPRIKLCSCWDEHCVCLN